MYCYLNPSTNKYDLYVGSDVSGVWAAHDIDPNFVNDPSQYHWVYISNDDITRFINKFVGFNNGTTDLLLVGYRNGIGMVDMSNQGDEMSSQWFYKNAWVSDISVSTFSGLIADIHFTTGTTRVNDEPANYKDNETVHDLYIGNIDLTGNITNLSFYDLPGLCCEQSVFCFYVDNNSYGNTDDDYLIGTESGLYQFAYTDLNNIPPPVLGPNRSTNYKATSILRIGTSNDYMITIHGMGLFKYNTSTKEWTDLINELNGIYGTNYTGNFPTVHDFKNDQTVQGFTRLIFVPGTNAGWILMNEENLVDYNGVKYFVGAFYSADDSGQPDGNWNALNVKLGESDWGWNNSTPCSNINSTLLTPNKHLIAGKSGNIFVTRDEINTNGIKNPTSVLWQQIYNCEQPITGTTCAQYQHRGYVNTAPKSVYNDSKGRVWIGMHDRLLWVSEDGGDYFQEVSKVSSTCGGYGIDALAGTNCLSISSIDNNDISDCFFITESPSNDLYACIGSGYASNKGLGFVLNLNETSKQFEQIGNPLCGDPVKLIFAGNEKYVLVNGNDLSKKLFWYDGSDWASVILHANYQDLKIVDALIDDAEDYLFVIATDGNLYRFSNQSSGNFTDNSPKIFNAPAGTACNAMSFFVCYNCAGYKLIVGTRPLDYNSVYDNLYSMKSDLTNSVTIVPTWGPTTIFQNLYVDDLDNSDGGVNYINVNPDLNCVYVSTVYYVNAPNALPLALTYKANIDASTFEIDNNTWQEINDLMGTTLPNKAVKFICSKGSTCGNEFILTSVRGLGAWQLKVNANDGYISAIQNTCNGSSNGELTANLPGWFTGTASYLWSDVSSQTTATATGLTAGTYTVTVTLSSGCTGTSSSVYTQHYTLKELKISLEKINACPPINGSAKVIDNLVNLPLSYQWSTNPIQTTATASGLTAGVYTVSVTDQTGCTVSASVNISNANFNLTLAQTPAVCSPGRGGTIDVTINNPGLGEHPYVYQLSGGKVQLSHLFEDLQNGVYTVTVIDDNLCTSTASTTVGTGTPLPLSGINSNQIYEVSTNANLSNCTFTGCNIFVYPGAAISLNSSSTVIFNNCTIQACSTNWAGVALNSSSEIDMDNTKIMNADIAIKADASGCKFRIKNSVFDNNALSLDIRNQSFSDSYIYNTRFDYSDLPEFDNRLPTRHINISNASNLIIGSDGSTASEKNYFTHALTGISVFDTDNLQICNSSFRKLGYDEMEEPGIIIRYGNGIYIENRNSAVYDVAISDYTVGSDSWQSCDFDNVRNGAYVKGNLNATISSNTFNENVVGVGLYNFSSSGTINVNDNQFANFNYGISGSYNNATCTLSNNRFNMVSSNNPVPYNFSYIYGSLAISYSKVNDQGSTISIQGNQINNTTNGIYLIGIKGANSTAVNIGGNTYPDNHVWFQIPASKITAPHHGVLVVNSIAINVSKNLMEWNQTRTDNEIGLMRGVSFKATTNSTAQENKMIKTAEGINFFGDCSATNLYCNTMDNCFNGTYLNGNGVTTTVSDQGILVFNPTYDPSQSVSFKNKWIDISGAGSNRVDGTGLSPLFTLNWTYNPADGAEYSPLPAASFVFARPCSSSVSFCSPPNVALDDARRTAMFGEAINDSTINDPDSSQFKYSDVETFYKCALHDSTILSVGSSNDILYQSKFDSIDQENIGKFERIKKLIYTDSLAQASALLASIDAQSVMDQNKKYILGYLITHNDDNEMPVGTDYNLLNSIAYTHPFYGGEAVYLARAILGIIVEDQMPALRLMHVLNVGTSKAIKCLLYPNPALQEVVMKVMGEFTGELKIEIYNATGCKLMEITTMRSEIKIPLTDIAQGVYSIKATDESGYMESNKLVILR